MSKRAETGPLRFGKDWVGLFIRGDHALYYALHLSTVIDQLSKEQPELSKEISHLKSLLSLLTSVAKTRGGEDSTDVQKLLDYEKTVEE